MSSRPSGANQPNIATVRVCNGAVGSCCLIPIGAGIALHSLMSCIAVRQVSFFLTLSVGSILVGCDGTTAPASSDDAGVPGGDGSISDDGGSPDGPPPVECIPPGSVEIIDGVDNNCDGQVDEQSVCATGAPFTSINAAIAAVPSGAVLNICPGTYHERLDIVGKRLSLIGTAGAASTIIDGGGAGTVISVRGATGTGVIIYGFTIRNGSAPAEGGGVRCEGSTLSIMSSTIVGNTAPVGGGGLYATGCDLEVSESRFDQNDGGDTGGGAMLVASSGRLTASHFVGNEANHGGGLAVVESAVGIFTNELRSNRGLLQGGGIYVDSDGEFRGNMVAQNTAGWTGGGIHVVKHAPVFNTNTVSYNTSANDGGGIYLHQSSAQLISNHFHHNTSDDDGGGVRIFESAMVVTSNLIEDNSAGDSGGGIRVSHVSSLFVDNIVRNNFAGGTGGGFDMDNDASTVRGGQIIGNRAGGSGGGIFCWLTPWNGAVIEDVLISGNRAWRGGGLFVDDNFMPVTMRNLRVIDNVAGLGGGLMVRATNYSINGSLFSGNVAYQQGGAIYAGVASLWWDVCPCPPTNPVGTITFSVFHGNTAPEGSVLWSSVITELSVENSILSANAGTAVTVTATSTAPRWRYNDTIPATFSGMTDPTGTDGNITMDPQFASVSTGNFSLSPGSACINAGDPTLLDADATRADMGMDGGL